MSNKQDIRYSRADIEKYWNGELSSREMHEMEAYALEDPFFSDALDGYRDVPKPTADKHLSEIREFAKGNIKNVQTKKKSIFYYAAAACMLLIGGLTFYVININNQSNDFAKQSREVNEMHIDTAAAVDALTVNEQTDTALDERSEIIAVEKRNIQQDALQPTPKETYKSDDAVSTSTPSVEESASTRLSEESIPREIAAEISTDAITQSAPSAEKQINNYQNEVSISSVKARRVTNTTAKKPETVTSDSEKLIVIDGKISTREQMEKLNPKHIASKTNLTPAQAVAKYGTRAENGAIEIITKKEKQDSAKQ